MTDSFQRRFPTLFAEIARSPRLYLHKINWLADSAYLIEADRAFFERASFLDDRALAAGTEGRWVPLETLRARVMDNGAAPPGPCHFIFHVGHCGSTLVSRLLGSLPGVLALREPAPLRGLADAARQEGLPEALLSPARVAADLALVRRLLARTFTAAEVPVVKATSVASILGPALLAEDAESRALLLTVGPEVYLASVFGDPGHVASARGLAPMRCRSLLARLPGADLRLYELSAGQVVALGWLSELLSLAAVAARAGAGRTLAMDFDAYLGDPEAHLAAACTLFEQPSDAQTLAAMLHSGLSARYAKRPEHPYSAEDRAHKLGRARREHAAEIAAGLAYAARLAERHAPAAGAVERFGYAGDL